MYIGQLYINHSGFTSILPQGSGIPWLRFPFLLFDMLLHFTYYHCLRKYHPWYVFDQPQLVPSRPRFVQIICTFLYLLIQNVRHKYLVWIDSLIMTWHLFGLPENLFSSILFSNSGRRATNISNASAVWHFLFEDFWSLIWERVRFKALQVGV